MRTRATILAALAALAVSALANPAFAQDPEPDCEDFATQAAAQTALRLDPSDPGGLDGAPGRNTVAGDVPDQRPHPGDGIACEDNPGTRDEEPVPASPSSSTTTTGPSTTQGEALPFTGPSGRTLPVAIVLLVSGAILLGASRYNARHVRG